MRARWSSGSRCAVASWKPHRLLSVIAVLGVLLCLWGCDDDDPPDVAVLRDAWTWVSGSDAVAQTGVYAGPNAYPGTRKHSCVWVDAGGNVWLFGGEGYASVAPVGHLNDLWRFDGTSWTWVSGSSSSNEDGVYSSPPLVPGARQGSATWIDGNGDLWLFGGNGRDAFGSTGLLADLWKFDGTDWTYESGSDTAGASGDYGEFRISSPTNLPGARYGAACTSSLPAGVSGMASPSGARSAATAASTS